MLINAYCTVRELPPLSFEHQPRARRDRSDPELAGHLSGFMGYLFPDGAQMTAPLYALIRHVQKVAHQVSLEVQEKDMQAFGAWLATAYGVAFLPDGTVRDSSGRVLFDPQGEVDEAAALPVSARAERRKAENHQFLAEQGVALSPHLPTVVSDVEVMLRPAREVAERALALLLTAVRAEGLTHGQPAPAAEMQERNPLGFAALSPVEQEFFASDEQPEELAIQLCWRYEALQTLLWTLNLTELPPPIQFCEVESLVGMMLDLDEEDVCSRARLRPTDQILDALDLHYRTHWAVRQADLEGSDPPAGMLPGVVLERHYALNWLTNFEDAPWDEVDTPT
jgi:hypothetical protein